MLLLSAVRHHDTTGGITFICCASVSDSITRITICTFHWNFESGENMQKPSWTKPGNLQTVLPIRRTKKIYTMCCLNTKFIRVIQTTVKEPSSPAEDLARFGVFCQGMYFHPLPEPMTLLSFWRKAKCIAHMTPIYSLTQQKAILVHPPLYTNFAYRVGDGMVLRKNRKAGFLFDFSYRQEHVDAHSSGMKVSKWSKHCSELAISPGVILLHFPGTQSGLDQTKAEVHNG